MSNETLDSVFVVTRGGRRVEPHNYNNLSSANARAKSLINMINEWDKPSPRNKVRVVKTSTPHRIR
ncbi:MAG: hypothetical protein VX765_01375 [Pseudomonadota bacterium]|nr:hypothetical protein [Pseudomonadota bacterium]